MMPSSSTPPTSDGDDRQSHGIRNSSDSNDGCYYGVSTRTAPATATTTASSARRSTIRLAATIVRPSEEQFSQVDALLSSFTEAGFNDYQHRVAVKEQQQEQREREESESKKKKKKVQEQRRQQRRRRRHQSDTELYNSPRRRSSEYRSDDDNDYNDITHNQIQGQSDDDDDVQIEISQHQHHPTYNNTDFFYRSIFNDGPLFVASRSI
mmetsp:Transcript_44577/g.108053  ORF Transcript_44577/g.108053 Transcript_44577/m.108053 type:complete len:209 (+) Transcript_44577:1718-2344(+)